MAHIGNAPPSFFTAVSSEVFSANGTATSFTLSKSISNLADIELIVNNIQQNPFGGSYSVSGSTLTFSEAPTAGSNNIVVTYRQATIGSTIPTPNTVGNNSLQSNLSLTGTTTTQHVVPSANITYDLGTSTMRYRDLFLSGGTITLGDVTLTTNGSTFSVANTTGGVLPSALGNTTVTGTLTTSNNVVVGNSTVNTSINSTSLTTGSNTATIGTAAYVVANGNVGVGTASPGYKLDVNGVVSSSDTVRVTSGTTVTIMSTAGSGEGTIGTSSNHALQFRTNNTERMRINAGAPILCLSGGSTTATGTGIAFPATQSASSDANTLDDYEEGNWTPNFVSDGGITGTTTVTNRWGKYVKIGRQVTVNFGWTGSLSGFTGVLQIGSLPFAVVTETTYQYGGGLECTSSTATDSNGSNFQFFAFSNSLYPRYTTGQTAGYLFNGASQVNGLTGIQGTMTYNATT